MASKLDGKHTRREARRAQELLVALFVLPFGCSPWAGENCAIWNFCPTRQAGGRPKFEPKLQCKFEA